MNIVVAGTIKQRMRGCTDEVMDSLQVAAMLNCSGQQGGFRTEPGEHIVTHALLRDISSHLTTGGGKPGEGYAAAMIGTAVRRLTPTECERLQGFPDGWTCLCQPLETYNANACTCPDGHRYQAMGNAVSVPVIEWIGKRLMRVAS